MKLFGGNMRAWLEDFKRRDFQEQIIKKMVGAEVPDEEIDRAIRSIPRHYTVGPGSPSSDGSNPFGIPQRQGKTLEQIVAQCHGKYYEASSRGLVFAACDQGAGVATVTTISTTSILSLYNPGGTGAKRVEILKRWAPYFSGTLGTGNLYDCVNTTSTVAAPTSGTTLANTCLDVGGGGVSVAVVKVASTVVAPVAVNSIAYLPPMLATTVIPMFNIEDDLDGLIVLEPGCCYQMQSKTAAGSSPLLSPGVIWMEIPAV